MDWTGIRGIEPGYANATETPIRGPEGPKVASKVLNMWGSASNPFLVHKKIENPKMLRMKFWQILMSKSAQNGPGTLIIRFALKNYAQKWSQIVKTLDE